MKMPEDKKKLLEEIISKAHPEVIAKFGNPLDENDPRSWKSSEREQKGVSAEDRLRFLELDVESLSMVLSQLWVGVNDLYEWARRETEEKVIQEAKQDPEGTLRRLLAGELNLPGETSFKSKGSPDTYAGSTAGGIAPDKMIETPDGIIRADQIPGYRNDPNWKPSPDWVDANCMCAAHVARRAEAKNDGDDNSFTGLYL